ncbi:hypothetical protein DFJ63DRAFT_313424 [Scheffersomyces coipomensis]|uniref:uncharacterized protein n=1 Tax=Scheffersomyces coipomensis TaxID=1788519 RepID=UPI00315CD857
MTCKGFCISRDKLTFKCYNPGPISKRRRKVANVLTIICSPVGMCAVNCTVKQLLINELLFHLGVIPGIIHALMFIKKLPDLDESQQKAIADQLIIIQESFKDVESIHSHYDQETLTSDVSMRKRQSFVQT